MLLFIQCDSESEKLQHWRPIFLMAVAADRSVFNRQQESK